MCLEDKISFQEAPFMLGRSIILMKKDVYVHSNIVKKTQDKSISETKKKRDLYLGKKMFCQKKSILEKSNLCSSCIFSFYYVVFCDRILGKKLSIGINRKSTLQDKAVIE